jgi:hypothetical protein
MRLKPRHLALILALAAAALASPARADLVPGGWLQPPAAPEPQPALPTTTAAPPPAAVQPPAAPVSAAPRRPPPRPPPSTRLRTPTQPPPPADGQVRF